MAINNLRKRNPGPRSATTIQRDAAIGQATQVLSSADMIEDYNNAMLPPCDGTQMTFCAITNVKGQTELLTVSDQGQLLWIYPDPTVSSGWSHATVDFIGISSAPQWLTGFYTLNAGDGSPTAILTVFYGTSNNFPVNPQCAFGMQYDGNAWSSVSIAGDASALLGEPQVQAIQAVAVDVGANVPNVLVYGVAIDRTNDSATFYFLGPEPGTNTWSVYYQYNQKIEDWFSWNMTVQAGLFPGTATGLVFMMSFGSNPSAQSWYAASLDWNSGTITTDLIGTGNHVFDRPIFWATAVPCDSNWYSFIEVDNTCGIANWLMSGGSQGLLILNGGNGQPQGVFCFGAGLLPSGLLVAFALEQNTNLLWMLQQTDQVGGGDFTWTQLGDYGTIIAVPPTMSVPQVIIYDDEGNIDLLSQNTNGSWFKNSMATPTQPSQTYPASSGRPQTFCTVLNPTTGNTELLTINAQGQLVWLAPDPSAPSGWNQSNASFAGMQDTPAWLCAFYTATPESDGPSPVLTVFYGASCESPSSAFGMQYLGNLWSSITLQVPAQFSYNPLTLPQKQPLQFVQTDLWGAGSPVTLVYGVALIDYQPFLPLKPLSFFLATQAGTGAWTVYYEGEMTLYGEGALAPYLLAGIFPGSATGLVFADSNSFGPQDWLTGAVTWSTATTDGAIAAGTLGAWTPPSMATPLQTISVPCDGAGGSYSLLVVDSYSRLTNFYINGATPGATQLSGGSDQPAEVSQLGVAYGTDGSLYAFALDPTRGDVWFLQERDQTGAGTLTWAPIGNFGSPVLAIAASSAPSDNPQLFVLNQNGDILLITFWGPPQPNTNQSWTPATIASPYQAPPPLVSATTYTIELTAVDANGNPVPGTVLGIEPDTPQTLVINNIAYPAGPGTQVLGVADAYGRVTVAALAAALASPELTVNICGAQGDDNATSQPAGSFRADYLMHNRLAGKDPQFGITVQDYQQANVLPSSVDPTSTDATNFCSNMGKLAQQAVNLANPLSLSSPASEARTAPRAYVFDFSTRGKLVCRDLTDKEIEALWSRVTVTESFDSFWSGLWGDVAHALKSDFQQIKKIYIQEAEQLSILITDIKDDVHTFTMEVIDDIRDGIEVVLQALNNLITDIVDFIKKAIDWLKAVFDWQDIINTKTVLKHMFTENINNLQTLLANPNLEAAIGIEFSTLGQKVNDLFGDLESIFGQQSFTEAGPQSSSDPMLGSTNPMLATPLNTQWSTSSMQINYATSKSAGCLPGGSTNAPGDTLAAQFSISSIIAAFDAAFESQKTNIQNAAAGLYKQMQNINSLSSFLDTGICAVLTAANEITLIIMAGVQAVIDAILDLGSLALTAMSSYLEQQINIPVISALYQQITGSPLTILDLMCLIAAIPCTLLYKIFYGGSEANPPFTATQVQTYCETPITWPWINQIGLYSLTAPASQDKEAQKPVIKEAAVVVPAAIGVFLGFINWVSDSAGDWSNVQQYFKGTQIDKDLGKIYGWTNVVASLLETVMTAPYTVDPTTAAGAANLAASVTPLLSWLADVANMMANSLQAKFIDEIGPALVGGIGVLELVVGINAAADMAGNDNFTIEDQLAAVMGSLSALGKWVTYLADSLPPASPFICAGVMAACNAADDIVVPGLSL